MIAKATMAAQSGIFQLGQVAIPTPPALVATTVLFPNTAALPALSKESLACSDGGDAYANFYYGGVDTPNTVAYAKAIATMEGGALAVLAPSGQSATVATMSALLKPGDHAMVVDTITHTTRWYIERLRAGGIDVTYYDPTLGAEVLDGARGNTRVIFMESPGSLTYEVQDVPAISDAAARRKIISVLDNTWSASQFFNPFDHAVDISILSLSKYHAAPVGVSMGAVVTNNRTLYEEIKNEAALLGMHVSPEACARASTSLASICLRLKHQEEAARIVMNGLDGRPELKRLVHPSRPDCVGHHLWRRDFSGANSLVTVEFQDPGEHQVCRLADAFKLVKIGYGWGGLTSLITIFAANEWRTVSRSPSAGTCMRIYVGLEDPHDILHDVEDALDRVMRQAR
jgi:cystathionine beta-lyase